MLPPLVIQITESPRKLLQNLINWGAGVGVVYSWAADIDEAGNFMGGVRAFTIEGNVYATLICHNFLGSRGAGVDDWCRG